MRCNLSDFYDKTRLARKIIVVDLGYLGDSIHLTPSLWELKRNYPEAELHVAAAPLGSEWLGMVPCVDRTWPLVRTPKGTPWRQQWRWIRAVRREQFDVAFNFNGADRTVFLTALTGAPWRVGFAAGRQHFWNSWLIPHWVPQLDRVTHVAEQRRQVLAVCGLTLGACCHDFQVPAWATRWAERNVRAGAVHLSINASHSLKEWPLEHWIALAQSLLRWNAELQLVATGTSREREQARLKAFAHGVASDRLTVFAGGLTVAQLAALLARCRLHVGGDSGALHLAVVSGLATVSLFRDYLGLGEWLPRGPLHQHVVVACKCVNQKIQPCLRPDRAECLAAVPPAQVSTIVERQLGMNGD